MSERPPKSVQHTLLPGVLVTGRDAPVPGRIIVLNRASSSGKSTIARELQEVAAGAWYRMAVAGMARGGNDVVVDHVLEHVASPAAGPRAVERLRQAAGAGD